MSESVLNQEQTRAIVLTGSGRGAVGVVQIIGLNAIKLASMLFTPNRGLSLQEGLVGRPRFGRFGGDEVVALVLETPTPEVEIHGHGGQAALEAILGALRACGVLITPYWNAPTDVLEMLAQAETLRVAGILFDQSQGTLEQELEAISQLENHAEARTRARRILDRSELGSRLLSGWKIVLTGRPNVGKSRLLNALAGFDRAIVSPLAGTTRDVVTLRAAIDGWPVEIADTAGIRSDTEGLESAGIQRAWKRGQEADLIVLVLDRSEDWTSEDKALIEAYPNALRVANKADLPACWSENPVSAIPVSAERGDGLDELMAGISRRLVANPPTDGELIPLFSEHIRLLQAIVNRKS